MYVRAKLAEIVPGLVVHVEFGDTNLSNAKMTVVRVNGDATNEVEIDANDEGFEITKETIRYHSL